MDWMNRGVRQNQTMNQPASHPGGQPTSGAGKSKRVAPQGWLKVAFIVLLFGGTAIIAALLLYTGMNNRVSHEGKYVDTSKIQAVFLNNGQSVYFGKIKTLNNRYMRLDDVFYLRVNQQVQPTPSSQQNTNPELVPLGCELHRPSKEMIITRDQITYWENLKDESDVATVPGAIKKYLADNPNGQKCATTSSSTDTTTKKQ